ncbi:hypothetical protein O3G_MSEX001100 [Manduca sexta]|nr:hypothetical protein O3G_MSEX001100 [Manduca sexta]
MARWKTTGSTSGGASGSGGVGASASASGSAGAGAAPRDAVGASCAAHVSRLAAAALVRAGAPAHCYKVLAHLLPYWKDKASNTGTTAPGQQLLKPQPPQPLPDMQPFFAKEYVKSK